MIEVISIIGVIVIFLLFRGLRKRVRKLEHLVEAGLVKQKPKSVYEPQQVKAEIKEDIREQSGPTAFDRVIIWLGDNWLLKLGSLLLLIGFGWFATYAFMNNWIGPMGRIALGIIAGALFLLFGGWRIRKYLNQGGIFMVLGSTIILLTLFAAREVYNFFTPITVLGAMFLSVAFVAFASVRYNSRALSIASLILAGVAPLLTNSSPNHIGLFSYLFVVILGAIWITVLTGKRELTTIALIIVACYSAPYFSSSTSADTGVLLLFVYAFAVLFFLTNTAGILKLKGKEMMPDLVTAAGNGLFLLAWIMLAGQEEWKSLIIAVWMVVFAVGAFLIFRTTHRKEPFYVYAGVGVVMLAVATASELKGAALTIAYTIESGLISFIVYSIIKDLRITKLTSLLLIAPIALSFESITSRAWQTGIFHKDFLVLLVLGIALLLSGIFFLFRDQESEDKFSKQITVLLLVLGSIYIYILLWLSLHAMFQNDNFAVMTSLLIYLIIGLISYFYGSLKEKKGFQIYGGVLIGLVVGRLLVIDVWKMELTGRITTFFLVGALLVGAAFIGRNKKSLNNSNLNK